MFALWGAWLGLGHFRLFRHPAEMCLYHSSRVLPKDFQEEKRKLIHCRHHLWSIPLVFWHFCNFNNFLPLDPPYGPKRETIFQVDITFYCGKIYITQNLQLCSFVALSTVTVLCKNHHHPFPEVFHFPNWNSVPVKQPPTPPSPNPWHFPFYFPSLWIWLL